MADGRRFDAFLGEVRDAICEEVTCLIVLCRYHHDVLTIPRIMFTIHNMDNSGECRQEEFSFTGNLLC